MNNRYLEALGQRVREKRIEAGMSQAEVAERMGFAHKSSISCVELGKRNLTTDQLQRLAVILGTTHDYLMDGDRGSKEEEIVQLFSQLNDSQRDATLAFLRSLVEGR